MKRLIARTLAGTLVAIAVATATPSTRTEEPQTMEKPLELGNFCICLAVEDIKASKAFYEKFDFKEVSGKLEQNWIVLQNGSTKIGLFQGMFEGNIMTFNPGWTSDGKPLEEFQDIREVQRVLKDPASFTTVDPDGNAILFDQHVPSPTR